MIGLLALASVQEVVERGLAGALQQGSEVHIATHAEIPAILLLKRADVSVVTLVAKLAVLVARAIAAHSFSIFCHGGCNPFYHLGVLPSKLGA